MLAPLVFGVALPYPSAEKPHLAPVPSTPKPADWGTHLPMERHLPIYSLSAAQERAGVRWGCFSSFSLTSDTPEAVAGAVGSVPRAYGTTE